MGKEPVKLIHVLFVCLLIASIFVPSEISFMGLFGLIVFYLAAGFFVPEMFDDLSRVLGIYICLILLVEGAHALTAMGYGIPIKGVDVGLLGISDGQGEMMYGWVELDISKEAIDASPALQTQMSWVAVAGSLVLVVFGAMYFIMPSLSNFPAVIASIMFFRHQAPFLVSDQSYYISQGWMSPAFAYFWLVVGLVALILAGLYATKKVNYHPINWVACAHGEKHGCEPKLAHRHGTGRAG